MRAPQLADKASEICERARAGEHVWVFGPEGSGRATLAQQLTVEAGDHGVLIEPPPLESVDAAAALLTALGNTAKLGGVAPDDWIGDDGLPGAKLGAALDETPDVLIIRLRGPWEPLQQEAVGAHERAPEVARLRQAIECAARARSVVWIADAASHAAFVATARFRVELPAFECLLEPAEWDLELAPLATQLRDRVGTRGRSPVVWRLAVGALLLGASAGEVAAVSARATSEAVRLLSAAITRRAASVQGLQDSLRRLLLVRRPLSRDRFVAFTRPPTGTEALLSKCLAYGDPVRVNDQLLRELRSALPACDADVRETEHGRLADEYQRLDGAASPLGLEAGAAAAWHERAHHLAHAGAARHNEWAGLLKPWPELYWDLARHLSVVRKRYEEAAGIYQDCLVHFPSDSYAHHYLAWNLEKASGADDEVRAHFAKAVKLDPSNPWWNARHISFLIRRGDWLNAKRAWVTALQSVDPDGQRSQTDAWLVAHLHHWVARAWLDLGVWNEARAVLDAIPGGVFDEASSLRRDELSSMRAEVEAREAKERADFGQWLEDHCPEEASVLVELWRRIDAEIPGLPVPAIALVEGGPSMVWSHPGVLVELEREGEGIAWYGRNRLEGESADGQISEGALAGPLPEPLNTWMHRVRHG